VLESIALFAIGVFLLIRANRRGFEPARRVTPDPGPRPLGPIAPEPREREPALR
jgi:hypothetical protein